ncbi:ABC transporter substrate-binding protein [Sedimentibacter sp.]|uniref:ABC transporter substrate-binding protein n=1 Tax=Sedimentibacter sp. TaxID=1960295 RepID=UPI0028B0DFAF|nr:ABC transporter substrate-binding protein [Sedimentibacter sp.]
MKSKLALFLVLIMLISITATGCTSSQTQTPAEPPKTEGPANEPEGPASGEPVKVGAILPLSGSAAATGVKLKYAIEVAQEIINGEHPEIALPLAETMGLPNLGNAPVQVVFSDHQGNPEIAKTEAERLIQNEKVVSLIGAYQSSATKPASQSAERFKIPFVAGSSSSAALTERGLNYFTRIAPNDDMETEVFFEYLKYLNEETNADIKTIGVVYIDNEYGVHAAEMVDKWLEEKYAADGFEKVVAVKYPTDVTSVDTEVQQIKAANPDVLFHASYIGDITQFVKKYKEFEFTPKAVVNYCGGFQDTQFVVNLDKDGDFFSGGAACAPTLFDKMEVVNQINELFKVKSGGENIDGPALEEFASLLVVADAINQAKSTNGDAVMEVIRTAKFDAPYFSTGAIQFDDKGQNQYSASFIVQTQNAEYEAVFPVDIQTAKPIAPFPTWTERK